MLTLFTIPKSFRGHSGIIQRNAIRSWTLLRPACEIILFGDDEGTAEAAAEFGVRHISDVARNEYGTPLVNDIFEKAQRLATHDVLCYVNADIILISDFMKAVQQVASRKSRFLMVGQRWDVDLGETWDFQRQDWEAKLRAHVREQGELHGKKGMDYFVFSRGLFDSIPAFAIGRMAWDNWLVYKARKRLAAVVDATTTIMAVHQNHEYGHFGSRKELRQSREFQRNRELMAYGNFNLKDATHKLLPDGLHFAWSLDQVPWHLERVTILFPSLRIPVWMIKTFLNLSRPVRSALNLTLSSRRQNTS